MAAPNRKTNTPKTLRNRLIGRAPNTRNQIQRKAAKQTAGAVNFKTRRKAVALATRIVLGMHRGALRDLADR